MADSIDSPPLWSSRKGNRSRYVVNHTSEPSATHVNPTPSLPTIHHARSVARRPVNKALPGQWFHSLIAEARQLPDLTGFHDLPQENGFLGLYIRILLWQPDFKYHRSLEHISPYSGRLGYQRPLEILKIGEGATFNVFKRYDLGSVVGRKSRLVVMKDSKASFKHDGSPKDEEAFRSVVSEIRVLSHSALRTHPNIVKLLDICWDHPALEQEMLGPTLYLEYAELGTLAEYRASHAQAFADNGVMRSILLDIVRALEALHQCGITHGDIKPSNILMFQDEGRFVAKVSDFGGAIFSSEDQAGNLMLPGLSPPWDSPEAGNYIPAELVNKSDIYSFGLLYWWCRVIGTDPFGLVTDSVNIFGFTGDWESRKDAFKALKKAQDLGSWMYTAIMNRDSHSHRERSLDAEVSVVAQTTLLKDPSQRTLNQVRIMLENLLNVEHMTEPQRIVLSAHFLWESERAWALPLLSNPLRSEPAHRFLEILISYSSQVGNARWSRMATFVLSFRCYLEGYGTAKDPSLAAIYLKEAARLGDARSQAIVSMYHTTFQLPPLDMVETKQYLGNAFLKTKSYYAMQDKIDEKACITLSRYALKYDLDTTIQETDLIVEFDELTNYDLKQRYEEMQAKFQGHLFHHAAARGWLQLLRAILKKTHDIGWEQHIDQLDAHGITPLVYACRFGNPDVILLLLDSGALPGTETKDSAGSLLNYLSNIWRDSSWYTTALNVAQRLVQAGANASATPITYQTLSAILDQNLDPVYHTDVVRDRVISPLAYAIWLGDLQLVQCLVAVGAVPDALCYHLAAGLHRVDLLEFFLQSGSSPFLRADALNVGGQTLLDSALKISAAFSTHQRLLVTRMQPSKSMTTMVNFLLTRSVDLLPANMAYNDSLLLHACRNTDLVDIGAVRQIFGAVWSIPPSPESLSKAATTAVIWNNTCVMSYLLSGAYIFGTNLQADILHACAAHKVHPSMFEKLFEEYKFSANLGCPRKTLTDLEFPIQIAVACQNFGFANYLFERGADREKPTYSIQGRLYELTLLGWLLQITWSESQHRIRYLFETYSGASTPNFIVMPNIGRSVLQHAASLPPPNERNEEDVRQMLRYLVERYPGSRYLEYQRTDSSANGAKQSRNDGWIYNGAKTMVKNDYRFVNPSKTFESTKEKEHNGTALLHAVRAINFPAVEVLLEAGSEASAVIGLPLSDMGSLTRKPASTCAVKENLWASTILDFAMLVKDRLESGIYPSSLADTTPIGLAYYKRRCEDILELLREKGAGHSMTFIGKANEERLYRTRREKGNIAALKLFKTEIVEGFSRAKKAGKEAMKGGMEEYKQFKVEVATREVRDPEVIDNDLANQYMREGRLDEAVQLYERALATCERQLGSDLCDYNELSLLIRMNMANAYGDLGRHNEAELHSRRAFVGFEENLSKKDGITWLAAHNYGAVLHNQGKYDEAEPIFIKALNGRKKMLGPDHDETLATLANLAATYSNLGKYDAADEAFERALRGEQNIFGPEHETVLSTVYAYGQHHLRRGEKEQAKAMLVRAFKGREKILGPEHFTTLVSAQGLAKALLELGEEEEAISLYERAYQSLKSTSGFESIKTTSAAFDLGLLYKKLGRPHDALDRLRQALRGQEKRLGPVNDYTTQTLYQIACVYKEQEERVEAERTYLQVLSNREANGLKDAIVRDSSYDLGILYHQMGRLNEAVPMFEAALKGEEEALGPANGNTLYTCFEFAKVLSKLARNDDAERMYLRAAAGREKLFGQSDMTARNSRFNLGDIYDRTDKPNEAASMFELALAGEEQALGVEHIDTLLTVARLANIYKRLKRYEESERYYVRATLGRDKQLGKDNKLALDTWYNFGLLYKVAGNFPAAAAQFRKAQVGYENTLGANHEETVEAIDKVAEMLEGAGNLDEASTMYRMALQRREESLGSDHEDTKASLRKLSNILDKIETGGPKQKAVAPVVSPVSQPPSDTTPPAALQLGELGVELSRLVQALPRKPPPRRLEQRWDLQSLESVLSGILQPLDRDCDGLTSLLWAVEHDHVDKAASLADMSAGINEKDKSGRTALHLVSRKGNAALTKYFLERGALLKARDAKGSSPLHHAAECSQPEVMEVLFAHATQTNQDIELEAENRDGYTPLHLAARKGGVTTAKLLIKQGASMSTTSSKRGIPAPFLAIEQRKVDMLRYFLDDGFDLEQISVFGLRLLHFAAREGFKEAVELLLDRGAELEAKDVQNDWTPLFFSCYYKHETVSQILLDKDANMYAMNADGIQLPHRLAFEGFTDPLRLLLENGADIETKDLKQATPLIAAASAKTTDALLLLLECGAEVNAKEVYGRTALHYAVALGNMSAAELLVSFDADINATDAFGQTPLHAAAGEGKENCTRWLLEKGADVNAKSSDGQTPLQLAAVKSQTAIMTLLILGASAS